MIMNRRTFLKRSVFTGTTLLIPVLSSPVEAKLPIFPMKTTRPESALVAWFSQTGHTRRYASIIASQWAKETGLRVDAMEISQISAESLSGYDLIDLGSPVYYCDVPKNVKTWLKEIPRIDGTPVATFVSSLGNNSHNTAYSMLRLLVKKGGVPAGLGTFRNMSTFPGIWASHCLEERMLNLKNLPNEATYAQVRTFADGVLDRIMKGDALEVRRDFSVLDFFKGSPQYYPTKIMITRHAIDSDRCVQCGICQKICPVQAINYLEAHIDHRQCMLCFGCLNNCPADAIDMALMGRKLTSFNAFLKRNHISIVEAEELSG